MSRTVSGDDDEASLPGVQAGAASRAVVLNRIRNAVLEPPRGAAGLTKPGPRIDAREPSTAALGAAALVELLIDRLEDYRADVVRADGDDVAIGHAIAETLAARGISQVIVPPGLPAPWTAELGQVVLDDGSAGPRELDRIPAVVTGSVVAVAETGTIVLDGSPRCGRRAITLVPDTHVCVVRTQDVAATVPDGLALVDPFRPLTFISGPSATSDIELNRVEGVHGPRNLIVVLAAAQP